MNQMKPFYRRFSTVVSGIQPSGKLHIGNYFGFISTILKLQRDGYWKNTRIENSVLFIADLHSQTSGKIQNVQNTSLQTASMLLACGVDPSKVILFRQSEVLFHASLLWLLQCQTSVSRLQRMIQWKEKSYAYGNNCGLLAYPVLQASDILLYGGNFVPVGPDQTQHLELTVDISQKLNKLLGIGAFSVPEPIFAEHRIRDLRNPLKKMSKSSNDPLSCIYLDDCPDVIREKISKAVTDKISAINYDVSLRPEISSLITLFSLVRNQSISDICDEFKTVDKISEFKKCLANCLIQMLEPIRIKYFALMDDAGAVNQILNEGAKRAQNIAQPNYEKIKSLLLP